MKNASEKEFIAYVRENGLEGCTNTVCDTIDFLDKHGKIKAVAYLKRDGETEYTIEVDLEAEPIEGILFNEKGEKVTVTKGNLEKEMKK